MVPAISNIPEAFDIPRKYQGRVFPPRKYDRIFREALWETQYPIKTVAIRYSTTIPRSITCRFMTENTLRGNRNQQEKKREDLI